MTLSFLNVIAQQGIDKPRYQILTKRAGNYLGTFNIELFPLIAPLATNNFDSLVTAHAYDSTAFHRVVPGFVIQGGDPNSINGPISTWGQGNPNQPSVPAEFSPVHQIRGILAAARDANPNSANSQFYICVASATFLDGQYTVYGKVTDSMQVVDTIVNSPRDANDNPLQKIEMFITYLGVNDTVPPTPTLFTPANNAMGVLQTQAFKWSSCYSAVLYRMEFSTDSLFSTINFTKDVADTSSTAPLLLSYTKYYWRIRSNNGGHLSIPSTSYSFTTSLEAPVLFSPADSSTNVFLNPVFKWMPVPLATSYTLQVATVSTFAPPYIVYNQSAITDTTQQVSNLIANHTYYWRLKCTDGTNTSIFSKPFLFYTGTAIGLPEVSATKSSLIKSVFPNPASSQLTVEISTLNTPEVKIIMQDLSGKEVYNSQTKITKTSSPFIIDVSKFERGMYLLIVRNGNEQEVQKVEIK